MKHKHLIAAGSLGLLAVAASGNQLPTSNDNPAYSQSNVQAQLRLNIREGAETVHFIRDTNDPKIITKTYVLKHADPYSIRPYLREMVQGLRVDYNNAAGQANPAYYNTYSKKTASGSLLFVPTGVECIKYADGTGILLVSAEDYRFKDSENGMGIDSLVANLDAPGILNSSGQPKFIYFPANRPASELKTLITNVGANVSNDTVELIGGKDKFEVDPDLNCLFFNTALYSRKNIEEMLKLYDVAHPEVRLSCTVYELDFENDGMIGLDFQSWKNNKGVKLFSTGATQSHNYNLTHPLAQLDPQNSHYFNFEPKWNTKYLDFLVSKGKAKVMSRGELTVKTGVAGSMAHTSGVMTPEATPIPQGNDPNEHGNEINVVPVNNKFNFTLTATPSITDLATTLDIQVATETMLGYTSAGSVRSSKFNTKQSLMLGNGRTRFYLGGLEKRQVVSDVGGVPLLKDLPGIGWLFATERESTKRSRVVVVADCELIHPNTPVDTSDLKEIEVIRKDTDKDSEWNTFGYRQYFIDKTR